MIYGKWLAETVSKLKFPTHPDLNEKTQTIYLGHIMKPGVCNI